MSSAGAIVTQLVIDARGATEGAAQFETAIGKVKAAAQSAGTAVGDTFAAAQRKWQQSLAATDPVLKAQLAMQRALEQQTLTGNRAVELGIATQVQAAAQLERVKQKHLDLIQAVGQTKDGFLSLIGAEELLERSFVRMTAIMAVMKVMEFAKTAFENAAALKDQAIQAGVSVEAFQAYRAVMQEGGVSADQASTMIARLTKNIGDAKDKSGPARDAFNLLGIGASDLANGVESAMPKIAASLMQIPDATQRARLEFALFGRSGQELEGALRALSDPTETLIAKQKALGQVLGTDVVNAAKEASDSLTRSWNALVVNVTPPIVWIITKLNEVIGLYEKWMPIAANLASIAFGGLPVSTGQGSAAALTPGIKPVTIGAGSNKDAFAAYSTPSLDKYIAQQKISVELSGLSAQRRAEEEATIAAANAKLADGAAIEKNQDGTLRKNVDSYAEARSIVGETTAKQIEQNAAIIEQGKAAKNNKETFAEYLASMTQAAQVAGETTAQRDKELAIIKGAQIVQKQRGATEKDLVQTYADALRILTGQQAAQISTQESAKLTAVFDKQISDQLAISEVALTASTDQRALAVQIAQKELELNRQLTQSEKDDLAAIQHKNDLVNLGSYMQNLRDQVSLAGLSADEREREAAVLQEMHATHGTLSQDQANEISGIISARQETEKWRSVVDGIQSGFSQFFDNILTKGKLDFGSLWQSIQGSFAQMLAQMAAQALVAPIIIPMVQSLAGSLGLSTGSLGGSGASSALGLLSGGSSLGGLFGGGGIGGGLNLPINPDESSGILGNLGGIFNTSLGGLFDTVVPGVTAPMAGLGIGSFTTSAFTSPGLLGTSLGGLLGSGLAGAGIGGLAGSLLFGNKNDSGIGSTGGGALGAAIGSIIPGVGTIIGGLLGGLLGGGLGSLTGSSNQSSIASFTNGGQNFGLTQTGSGQNTQLVTQAAQAINQAVIALTQAGVTVKNNISGIGIGSEKDYIYYQDGGKQKLGSASDPNDVINQVLKQLLSTASATDVDIQKVINSYQGKGGITTSNLNQFLTDIGFANSLKNSQAITQSLTQSEQQISSINSQFQTLIDHASQLGLDTQSLVDQRDAADQQVYENVLGVLEAMTPANDNADQWKQAMDAIAAAEKEAASAATDLGYSLDDVNAAANSARQALSGSFNAQISDSILKLTNPNLEAYNTLIATQTERIKEATEAGADLNSVYQLNNLEQQQLLQTQADAAAQAAQQEAQIQQAAADALAAAQQQRLKDAISGLTNNLGDLSTQATATAKAAQAAADNWGKAYDSITQARTALLISSPGLSPIDQYNASRSQFGALSSAGLGGDVTAAGNAASFAGQFLQSSFNYNGSTAAYGSDFSYVQNTLSSLSDYTKGQQTTAQAVADQYNQMINLLSQLKDAISNNSTINSDGFNALETQFEGVSSALSQANLQNRFAA